MNPNHLCSDMACGIGSPCPVSFVPYVPKHSSASHLPFVMSLPTKPVMDRSTVEAEYGTYYLLWKQISLLTFHAKSSACHQSSTTLLETSIPGWKTELIINLVEPNELAGNQGQSNVPFTILSSRPNAINRTRIDYLISVRGTMSLLQWEFDFAYETKALNGFDVHQGFLALASAIWQPLQRHLSTFNDVIGLITLTGRKTRFGVYDKEVWINRLNTAL